MSAVPRPRSYTPPPPAAGSVAVAAAASPAPEKAAALASAEAPSPPKSAPVQAPTAAAERAFAAHAEDGGTLRPSEVDPPVVTTRRRSLSRFVASLGIAAAMVLASLAWVKGGGVAASSQLQKLLAPEAPPLPKPAAAPKPPEPPALDVKPSESPLPPGAVLTAVEPAPTIPPPPAAPPATTETASAPTLSGAVSASLAKPGSTHVVVKTVPSGAAVFEAGKRVGTGLVELDIEKNTKRRLTVLLDGHKPVNITVDGSRETVTIVLRPVPRAAPGTDSSATTSGADGEKPTDAPAATPAGTTEAPSKPYDPFAPAAP